MIKFIDNFSDCSRFPHSDDVFFQRIYSDFRTESVFDDASFYANTVGGNLLAVISKIKGSVTVSADKNADFKEISEFLKVIGYSSILCDKEFSDCFDGAKTCGKILVATPDEKTFCKANELYTENLKDVFNLIVNAFEIQVNFDEWFADMSHKLRHKGARLFGIYSDKSLISAAFSMFETEKSAVISSFATDKEKRCQGYGEMLLKTLLSENQGKNVYVFTENTDVENWYKKFGFTDYKGWSEIK